MPHLDTLHETAIYTNFDIRYWSEKFNVSPQQLRAAIKKVGNSVAALEKELRPSSF